MRENYGNVPSGIRYVHSVRNVVYFLFWFCKTRTATTMAIITRMIKLRMKQIQRFLRAARAESTALPV